MKKFILLFSALPIISACSPAYEDLSNWMTETKQQAKSKIIPFEEPVVNPPKSYVSPNFSGMDAFNARRLINTQKSGNAPDTNRPKETLEAFSLENMQFVGLIRNGNKVSGFIRVENHVYTVLPGNYIGQNYGRIQNITEDKIILTEQVEDSLGNWVYRKAELPLSANAENGERENPSAGASSSDSSSNSNNSNLR